jgi:hypothetical protein
MSVETQLIYPQDVDNLVTFSATRPILVDYRDLQHYYIWCDNNLDLDAGQYGTLHLQASVWNELPLEQGTKLAPVGLNASSPQIFNVLTRATNKSYVPVPPIQFDISNLTANSNGADLMFSIGVPYYKLCAMQLAGTWVGTVQPQQSIDGVNYNPTVFTSAGDTTQARSTGATVNGLYRIPLIGRYFKAHVTAFTSGVIVGSFIFYMNPVDM